MSKKHFIALAKEIANMDMHDKRAKELAADIIVKVATSDNPRFDAERFYKACGL